MLTHIASPDVVLGVAAVCFDVVLGVAAVCYDVVMGVAACLL